MSFLNLVGLSLISPNKMINTVFKEDSKKNLIQAILYAFLIIFSLAYIIIYAQLGDFSEIYLYLKEGYTITYIGFIVIPNLYLSFMFLILYSSLTIFILPIVIFGVLRAIKLNKNEEQNRSGDNDIIKKEKINAGQLTKNSILKMVELGAISLTPLLIIENICIIMIISKLQVLSVIRTLGDYLLLMGLLFSVFYYIIILVIASNRAITDNDNDDDNDNDKFKHLKTNPAVLLGEFTLGLFIIVIALGVFYL